LAASRFLYVHFEHSPFSKESAFEALDPVNLAALILLLASIPATLILLFLAGCRFLFLRSDLKSTLVRYRKIGP
jgi:hypothetical protein